MKKIVVYNSKRGSTKRYAQMLAEEIDAKAVELKKFNAKRAAADIIVFGSWLFANQLKGLAAFERKVKKSSAKTIYFCCGYTPESQKFTQYLKARNQINELFYLRGKTDLSRIKGSDESIIKSVMRELTLIAPSQLTDEENSILAAVVHNVDYVDRRKLLPIKSYIDSIDKNI